MGDSAEKGVVNHAGQVYAAEQDTKRHKRLCVIDSAINLCSFKVNPCSSYLQKLIQKQLPNREILEH